jgi:hypothetical protein
MYSDVSLCPGKEVRPQTRTRHKIREEARSGLCLRLRLPPPLLAASRLQPERSGAFRFVSATPARGRRNKRGTPGRARGPRRVPVTVAGRSPPRGVLRCARVASPVFCAAVGGRTAWSGGTAAEQGRRGHGAGSCWSQSPHAWITCTLIIWQRQSARRAKADKDRGLQPRRRHRRGTCGFFPSVRCG